MKTKVKNKLYTKSYFVKRLVEAGFNVEVLADAMAAKGDEYWRMRVGSNGRKIVVVCHKRGPEDYHFALEGLSPVKVVTRSMEVVIEQLRCMTQDAPKVSL